MASRDQQRGASGLVIAAQSVLIVTGIVLGAWALFEPESLRISTKDVVQGNETTHEYDTTLAVAVLAVSALLILVGALLNRITEVTLPGGAGLKVSSAWTDDAKEAAAQTPDEGDGDGDGDGDSPNDGAENHADNLLEVRAQLEQRLTWMAKHFVGPDGEPLGFVTPGSLRHDRYLTPEQMRTASRILTTSTDALPKGDPRWRAFLADGERLVRGIRVGALQNKTYDVLCANTAWRVTEDSWRRGRRPDLVVYTPDDVVRVAPVFPYQRTDAIGAASRRLESLPGKSVIVVPRTDPVDSDVDQKVTRTSDVPVVYLDQIAGWIARQRRPDALPG